MLVVTASLSPKRGLPVKFCVDFNHFKYTIMHALLQSKTLVSEQLYAALSHATKEKLVYPSHLYEFVI